jgi:hypothetical protein
MGDTGVAFQNPYLQHQLLTPALMVKKVTARGLLESVRSPKNCINPSHQRAHLVARPTAAGWSRTRCVPVCSVAKAPRHKSFAGVAAYGHDAMRRSVFYGLCAHLRLCSGRG